MSYLGIPSMMSLFNWQFMTLQSITDFASNAKYLIPSHCVKNHGAFDLFAYDYNI